MRPAYFTRVTAEFVDQAHQFCDFIERAFTLSLRERLAEARVRLLDCSDGTQVGELLALRKVHRRTGAGMVGALTGRHSGRAPS
jgi:hypothetical protein